MTWSPRQVGITAVDCITGVNAAPPCDPWQRWDREACPSTPPAGRLPTAGLKTHRYATLTHWPLGRREGGGARAGGGLAGESMGVAAAAERVYR